MNFGDNEISAESKKISQVGEALARLDKEISVNIELVASVERGISPALTQVPSAPEENTKDAFPATSDLVRSIDSATQKLRANNNFIKDIKSRIEL